MNESPRNRARLRKWVMLGALMILGGLAHEWSAAALVDHGVAGALLAGGGGWSTVLAAAAFLLLRLVNFVALASIPALLVAGGYSLAISKMRGGLGSPSK